MLILKVENIRIGRPYSMGALHAHKYNFLVTMRYQN